MGKQVRVNVGIDSEVLYQMKVRAAQEGFNLGGFLDRVLRQYLKTPFRRESIKQTGPEEGPVLKTNNKTAKA